MKISIIVPAFNEEKLLGRCLAAVNAAQSAFTDRGWLVERIVCDNNSTDDTPQIAEAHGVRVVFEPINQISRARNCGAQAAIGDWLLFIDADSYPSRELLQDVAETISSDRVVGGGATVRLEGAPAGWSSLWNFISRTRRWVAGSFIFCSARAFQEIGGFSLDLYASEEIEFSQRLKQAAKEQGKSVVILHRHPLLTSGRKVVLCKYREFLWLLLRTLWYRGENLRRREDCAIWYDGRR